MSSGTFALRRALPADAEAVRTLVRQAYAKWVPLIGREPKPMTANYATAVRLNRIDLACEDGKLAGLIETIDRSDDLLIENVAVGPSFQGRGLGRTLMAHAERVAAAQSYRTIRLYTNKAFAENVALYLRLGYRIDREEESALGVTVYMSKPLP
jgi:ribosomal protein S18 acetylase RimI-like enzyme